MSNPQFPFYLSISSQHSNTGRQSKTHPLNNIYTSFQYPNESQYKIITSINPSNSVLLSYSKQLTGSILNKKLISKDDLYQYYLKHTDSTILKFSFAFNELLTNDFKANIVINPNQKMQNILIFGQQKKQFIQSMLIPILNKTNQLKLSFYYYECYTKEMVLVHPSLKNIEIGSLNDISNSLVNMRNEYKLSMISIPKNLTDNNGESNRGKIMMIVANSNNCLYNLITSSNLLSIEDIHNLINSNLQFPTSLVLNIIDHSDNSIELVKKYYSICIKPNEGNVVSSSNQIQQKEKEDNRKNNYEKLLAIPNNNKHGNNRNNSNQEKENTDQSNYASIKFKENQAKNNINGSNKNETNISQIDFDYVHIKQENVVLQKLNQKLTTSLEQERQEKLTYINENSSLINQIKKFKTEISVLSTSMKKASLNEEKIYSELKEKEEISFELQAKEDQIRSLLEEKSYIEVEYQVLKEKYDKMLIDYNDIKSQNEEAKEKQEQTFKDIETKISKLEQELTNFQKGNETLLLINQKQQSQIDSVTKLKEKYYDKYKTLKSKFFISYPKNKIDDQKEIQSQLQYPQNRLIENIKTKIRQINTESLN